MKHVVVVCTLSRFFVRIAHTRYIRFRSRSPRSHVRPLVVCVSPKRRVSRALNTPPIVLRSTIRMHHEGGNTWAIRRTYNGYTTRRPSFSPVSRVLAKPQCLCTPEAVMRLDIMHPHRTQDDIATCPHWYSNLDEKAIPGRLSTISPAISTFCKRDCVAFIENMRRIGRLN